MPRVQAFLLCRRAEKIGGHFRNLFDIFDEAAVEGLPAAAKISCSSTVWFRSMTRSSTPCGLAFTTPSGIAQLLPPVPIEHPEERILQGIVRFSGIRFYEAGEHTMTLHYEGREIARCGILVTLPEERAT